MFDYYFLVNSRTDIKQCFLFRSLFFSCFSFLIFSIIDKGKEKKSFFFSLRMSPLLFSLGFGFIKNCIVDSFVHVQKSLGGI